MVSSFFLDGPVTVGMSLDIASIDTISEINMVRVSHYFLKLNNENMHYQSFLINGLSFSFTTFYNVDKY